MQGIARKARLLYQNPFSIINKSDLPLLIF